jgi:hypothetical protein
VSPYPVFVRIAGLEVNPATVTFICVDRHDTNRSVIGFIGDSGSGHRVDETIGEVRRLLEGGKP